MGTLNKTIRESIAKMLSTFLRLYRGKSQTSIKMSPFEAPDQLRDEHWVARFFHHESTVALLKMNILANARWLAVLRPSEILNHQTYKQVTIS